MIGANFDPTKWCKSANPTLVKICKVGAMGWRYPGNGGNTPACLPAWSAARAHHTVVSLKPPLVGFFFFFPPYPVPQSLVEDDTEEKDKDGNPTGKGFMYYDLWAEKQMQNGVEVKGCLPKSVIVMGTSFDVAKGSASCSLSVCDTRTNEFEGMVGAAAVAASARLPGARTCAQRRPSPRLARRMASTGGRRLAWSPSATARRSSLAPTSKRVPTPMPVRRFCELK